MTNSTRPGRIRRSIENLRSDWTEIGGLGRLAVVGVGLSLVVTVILGFSITNAAEGHLLEARAAMVTAAVAGLPPYPSDRQTAEFAEFDVAVRVSVLGGETIRFKVWAPDGTIVYSDAAELIGQQFNLPLHAGLAFEQGAEAHISDLSDPAHAFDRGEGELIEFYVALGNDAPFVAEVEQDASGLAEALSKIARNVWLSIGLGFASISVVMAFGIAARGRELNRRRRQAEQLLESSFIAQEEGRRRVVSALHDDIGQPMYRLLYGLEGSQAKVDPTSAVAEELGHLTTVVREMDATLRNELRLLNFEVATDVGLASALKELIELTESETDLTVKLSIDLDFEPSSIGRNEMYRATREAITNVRKHANAQTITVNLRVEHGRLILEVIDDGIGPHRTSTPGLGLGTTRQRFVALEGNVVVEANPTGGTRFTAWLPETQEGAP